MRISIRTLALLAAFCAPLAYQGVLPAAGAAWAEEGAKGLRPEVAKAVQGAAEAIKAKRGKDALAKLAEADAIKEKTAYETFMVERTRGQAAAAAGDAHLSAKSFELAAASSAAPEGEKKQLLAAAAGQYYAAKEYGKAVEASSRYYKEGGTDRALRTVYVQALYLGGDFGRAAKEILADVQTEEREGKVPSETNLQLLANAYLKQQDNNGYANAMEKLVAHYPKKEYWLAVIHAATTRNGFPERLAVDAARLKLATGTMRVADEYVEAAQLTVQAGLPAEAKKFVDAGYAANLLGGGAEADRHRRLKDLVAKNLAEDARTLGQDDAQVIANKDGTAQFNAGLNYVLHGKADKGLDMMEKGLAKGGIKRPEDARLRLGYAYQLAGQKAKAVQAFKAIPASEPASGLARLWIIRLGQAAQ